MTRSARTRASAPLSRTPLRSISPNTSRRVSASVASAHGLSPLRTAEMAAASLVVVGAVWCWMAVTAMATGPLVGLGVAGARFLREF